LGKRYILTPTDVLTVHRIKDVKAGDILRLTRILELGSRDYTLRAPSPVIGKALFEKDWQRRPDALGKGLGKETVRVECRVLEHGVGKEMIVIKQRRRKRYRRRLLMRNMYTKLLVTRLEIGNGVDVIE
jgi:large subunit ribosomal protein L21